MKIHLNIKYSANAKWQKYFSYVFGKVNRLRLCVIVVVVTTRNFAACLAPRHPANDFHSNVQYYIYVYIIGNKGTTMSIPNVNETEKTQHSSKNFQ